MKNNNDKLNITAYLMNLEELVHVTASLDDLIDNEIHFDKI